MWKVSGDPQQFEEALAYWRARVPLTEDEYEALTAAARAQAFTIAGVGQLDLIADTMGAIDRALEQGTTLADFKAEVGAALEAAWGAENPARLELIFRNAVQRSYSAGRYQQMTEPAVLKARPIWVFDAVLDSRTSSLCRSAHGTTLPADDPWWQTHIPPLHHNCRSGIRSVIADDADGQLTEDPTSRAPGDGFGLPPDAPPWEPSEADYPAPLWRAYQRKGGP